MNLKKKVIIILGPTASGKTALAVRLAKRVDGEIISADSRQVFCGMDIGSGKDLSEYGPIPHHLIDIRPAGSEYSVSDFQRDALSALSDITSRSKSPIICGGTGHYVKSLLDDYVFESPGTDLSKTLALESLPRDELYRKIKALGLWEQHHWESDSRRRMARAIEKETARSKNPAAAAVFRTSYDPYCFYLAPDRTIQIQKIEKRLKERLASGLVEEVERLISEGVSAERMERYGLEYRWVTRYLRNELSLGEMTEKLAVEIRRYAKRQMTFIRYLQKQGHQLQPIDDPDLFLESMSGLLGGT